MFNILAEKKEARLFFPPLVEIKTSFLHSICHVKNTVKLIFLTISLERFFLINRGQIYCPNINSNNKFTANSNLLMTILNNFGREKGKY